MKFGGALKTQSLTYKLLAGTLTVLTGYILTIGILAYISTNDSIGESYDESLIVNANALLFLMQEEAREGGLDKPLQLNISADNLKGDDKDVFAEMSEYRMLRVWYKNNVVLDPSETVSVSGAKGSARPFPEGFSDQEIEGASWRVYSLHVPSKELVIELGEQVIARQYLVLNIAKDLILPFIVSLPLVGFLFWRAIQSGVADLHRVASQVDARTPEQMTPLETAALPSDLLPLVNAINALLNRLDQSMSRERQVTERAAHELRTPLTAIKLQAQMGLKASTDAGRVEALHGLLQGVERSSYLIEQLLTLTRVEQTRFDLYDMDANATVERVLNELKPLANRRRQTLHVESPAPLIVRANDDLLYLTLSNVIGNAVKYAPEDTHILLKGEKVSEGVHLDVVDEGPGIPAHLRDKIFERFFRYNQGKVIGSGIGLTIARECAGQMSATLSLLTPPSGRGLCVRLTFRKEA